MKAVPKIPKAKSIIKQLSWFDFVYTAIFAAIIGIILFTNIGFMKFVIALCLAVFCGITLIQSDDVSRAHAVYYILKNSSKIHNYSKSGDAAGDVKELLRIDELEDGYIKYSNNVYAGVIEIRDVNFLLLDESIQEGYVKALASAFNTIAEYHSVSLFKTERRVDFEPFIAGIEKRISDITSDRKFSHREKKARINILESKAEQYCDYKGKIYITVYHLVIRGSKDYIDKTASEILERFSGMGIDGSMASRENIATALKSQFFGNINEDEEGKIAGMSSDELINWIYPDKVRIRNKYCEMDNRKVKVFAIKNLPNFVDNAWLATLFNISEVNVTLNAGYANKRKTVRQIDNTYFNVENASERTVRISEATANGAVQSSMEALLEDMTYNQDKICYIELLVAFVDDGKGKREKDVAAAINEMKMQFSRAAYNQYTALNQYLMGARFTLARDYRLLMTTYLVGKSFPMVFPNLLESDGELIGENKYGIPVAIDFFKRDGKLRVNSNMIVTGKSGGGKSFFLKTYLIQAAARGNKVLVFDPEDEYQLLGKAFRSVLINLNDGKIKINPLQAYPIDEDGLGAISSHVEVLDTFFRLLFPDLSSKELLLIKQLILDFYQYSGITDDINVGKLKPDEFPTVSELYDYVESEKSGLNAEPVKPYIKALTLGQYGKIWNGVSNISLKNNFIIFNLQSLLATNNLVLANAQMLLLVRYINVQLINNYRDMKAGKSFKKIIALFDEVHRFLDPKMPVMLDMLNWAAKQFRKYEAALITASQSVIDFAQTEEILSKTKALLTESQMSVLFGANPAHIPDIKRIYQEANFTASEIDGIKESIRGHALFMLSPVQRLDIHIKANPTEYMYCIRPADLKAE